MSTLRAWFLKLQATDTTLPILLLRLSVGLIFISEGTQKFLFPDTLGAGRFATVGFPWPEALASFVATFEVTCGTLVLFGAFIRLAVIPLSIIMLVAITTTKLPMLANSGLWKMAHEARTDFLTITSLLFLFVSGAGRCSVDASIKRRVDTRATLVGATRLFVVILLTFFLNSCAYRDGRISSQPPATPPPASCPHAYVRILGNNDLKVPAFCAAQFEMRRGTEGKPVSIGEGKPWYEVTLTQAKTSCESLGDGYTLLSNEQWQTIAREIETNSRNWSSGTVGQGTLNIGNFSFEMGGALADDPCSTEGYPERFAHCKDPHHADFIRKRTHQLKSGEDIWDIGGNVWEWVSTPVSASVPGNFRGFPCQTTGVYKQQFGPAGSFTDRCDASNSDGFGCTEGSGGTVIFRGGQAGMEGGPWDTCAGIFYANTNSFWDAEKTGPGFRCGYRQGD